jgi:hypothetical protein
MRLNARKATFQTIKSGQKSFLVKPEKATGNEGGGVTLNDDIPERIISDTSQKGNPAISVRSVVFRLRLATNLAFSF